MFASSHLPIFIGLSLERKTRIYLLINSPKRNWPQRSACSGGADGSRVLSTLRTRSFVPAGHRVRVPSEAVTKTSLRGVYKESNVR